MKKIASFITALILFLLAVIIIHFSIATSLKTESKGFGTWINPYKDLSYSAVINNLNDDTYMMLGSSEFQHGKDTKYHPEEMFRSMGLDVMCIGAAYNQCLSHAITLGAVAPELKTKKVLLILSPAWFDKKGVRKNGFSVRFSESEYMEMLKSPLLSKALKEKIAKRTYSLLGKAPALRDNVERYNNIILEKDGNLLEKVYFDTKKAILNEKEAVNINALWKVIGKPKYEKFKRKGKVTGKVPNWEEYKVEADEEFNKTSKNNPFHMRDRIYKHKFKAVIKKQKGAMSKRKFWKESPEYKDLDLFFQVCKATDMEVQVILLPINGYWYDHTGFKEDARNMLPGQIKEVADQYSNVNFVSFFDRGYEHGFLEDAFHPAGKGWTEINEKAYKFFTKNKKSSI